MGSKLIEEIMGLWGKGEIRDQARGWGDPETLYYGDEALSTKPVMLI